MTSPVDEKISAAFDAHARALLLYARQWVDADTAEDVVQRVFVQLVISGKLPNDFRPWLFRCVRNESISQSRSVRRRKKREGDRPLFEPNAVDAIDLAEAQSALLTMPTELREVVTLRIWSELTFAEISAVTGRPLSTVHDQFKSALAELRNKLEPSCRNR